MLLPNGHGVSIVLGYEWKRGRKEISHSFECVEGHI
jgi:hypothetical protein